MQSSPREVIEDLENMCVVRAYYPPTPHFFTRARMMTGQFSEPVRAVQSGHGQTSQAHLVLSR